MKVYEITNDEGVTTRLVNPEVKAVVLDRVPEGGYAAALVVGERGDDNFVTLWACEHKHRRIDTAGPCAARHYAESN